MDSEENLTVCTEKIPSPSPYDWSFWISSSTYKYRNEEFKRQFPQLPDLERLVVDYACALQKDILLQGRLYLSENWLCFYSNIFRWETTISIALKDITFVTKEKTAWLIPNAIQITTEGEKFFFTSFNSRDRSFLNIFRLWQNALLEKRLKKQEFWQIVQQSYGSELGLNTEEMENFYSSSEENGQSRSSLCDESVEKDEKPSKAMDVIQEPIIQILETESLNGNVLTVDAEPEESHCDRSERRSSLRSSQRKSADLAQRKHSGQLPDLNENFSPEKSSPSESDGEDEKTIPEDDLHGKIFVNRVFHIGADRMFEMLFTNSHFMQRYQNSRNITDTVQTPWCRDAGGNQLRTMTYTLGLKNPLIGKFTSVTEKQVLHKQSHKGLMYRVDADVFTHDVPYHDYFYTVYTYCITHMSSQKCRLRVSSDVKYKKQPWGLVKTIIEKNTWGGFQESFQLLESELLMEAYAINKPIEDPAKLGVLRRRKWTLQRNIGEILPKRSSQYSAGDAGLPSRADTGECVSLSTCYIHDVYSDRTDRTGNLNVKNNFRRSGPKKDAKNKTITIIVIMSIFLLLLVLLNVTLFLKLSKIENAAQSFYRVHLQEEGSVNLALNMASREKISQHDKVQHVKGVLRDSIALLEQLKNSLSKLQSSFDHLNKTKSVKPES
ncbi:protein Aster-C isoform X2 [Paroedura picta]